VSAPPAPDRLADALAHALGRDVARLDRIPGGDLNAAYAATLADDATRVFVKTRPDAAPGAFAAEAAGLRWLAEPAALAVPDVLAVADEAGPRFLAVSWIEAGPATPASDEALGRGLARMHAAGAPGFGGPDETWRIGPIALPNAPAPDWPTFYATRRIEPLARRAADRQALTPATPALLDRVLARLPDLAGPPEPPARVHGDLWGANVLVDRDQTPWLIDPAAHGGHRELDLAMLRLFGGPGERCFAAYEEQAPLPEGAADRVALWQLAPLLLHAALFGASYASRVEAALRAYA